MPGLVSLLINISVKQFVFGVLIQHGNTKNDPFRSLSYAQGASGSSGNKRLLFTWCSVFARQRERAILQQIATIYGCLKRSQCDQGVWRNRYLLPPGAGASPQAHSPTLDLLQRSPRALGKSESVWTQALFAEVACEKGMLPHQVSLVRSVALMQNLLTYGYSV